MVTPGILPFALAQNVGKASLQKIINLVNERGYSWDEVTPDIVGEAGLKSSLADNVRRAQPKAQQLFDQLTQSGITLLIDNEPAYPQRLRDVMGENRPILLQCKGDMSLLEAASVAFAGTEDSDSKTLKTTKKCVRVLIKNDIAVIAAYLDGVDMEAHTDAVSAKGKTIMVANKALDSLPRTPKLAQHLTDLNHLFLMPCRIDSEGLYGTSQDRDAVVAALSHAVVLIDAPHQSENPAFRTALIALRQNRPVFALEAADAQDPNAGNEFMLRHGAQPIHIAHGKPGMNEVIAAVES